MSAATWAPGWENRVRDEQKRTHVHSMGIPFARIPYGSEVSHPRPNCRDCGVMVGQFHVWTCCVERCPVCDGQAMWCPDVDENLDAVTEEELRGQK